MCACGEDKVTALHRYGFVCGCVDAGKKIIISRDISIFMHGSMQETVGFPQIEFVIRPSGGICNHSNLLFYQRPGFHRLTEQI